GQMQDSTNRCRTGTSMVCIPAPPECRTHRNTMKERQRRSICRQCKPSWTKCHSNLSIKAALSNSTMPFHSKLEYEKLELTLNMRCSHKRHISSVRELFTKCHIPIVWWAVKWWIGCWTCLSLPEHIRRLCQDFRSAECGKLFSNTTSFVT
ncbi:hypothetical protein GCK32_007120, partial [Trichostrongylus colubriformis]